MSKSRLKFTSRYYEEENDGSIFSPQDLQYNVPLNWRVCRELKEGDVIIIYSCTHSGFFKANTNCFIQANGTPVNATHFELCDEGWGGFKLRALVEKGENNFFVDYQSVLLSRWLSIGKNSGETIVFHHPCKLQQDPTCMLEIAGHFCAIQRLDGEKWVRAKSGQSPERFIVFKKYD